MRVLGTGGQRGRGCWGLGDEGDEGAGDWGAKGTRVLGTGVCSLPAAWSAGRTPGCRVRGRERLLVWLC